MALDPDTVAPLKAGALWKLLLLSIFLLPATACRSIAPAQPPLSPAIFTPDGAGIIFSAARGETCFLFEADVASGSTHRLTKASSGCETDPAFSPDGKQLAFMRAPRSGAHAALMVANPDGSAPRTLVAGDEDNLQPVFIPYSNQILFLRSDAFEHYSPVVNNRRHKFDLFSADLFTGRVTALTHKQFYEISHVSVSADGQQVLLSVYDSEGSLFLAAPTANPGAPTLRLQPKVPDAPEPSPALYNALWLPNGASILFSAAIQPPNGGDFNYNVYRLTISSGTIEQLTHLTGLLDGLSVSANGEKAVLLHHGAYSVLDLDTGKLAPISLKMPA